MVIRRYHRFIPNLTRRDGSAIARPTEEQGSEAAMGTRHEEEARVPARNPCVRRGRLGEEPRRTCPVVRREHPSSQPAIPGRAPSPARRPRGCARADATVPSHGTRSAGTGQWPLCCCRSPRDGGADRRGSGPRRSPPPRGRRPRARAAPPLRARRRRQGAGAARRRWARLPGARTAGPVVGRDRLVINDGAGKAV
jgi:hypothetical protein